MRMTPHTGAPRAGARTFIAGGRCCSPRPRRSGRTRPPRRRAPSRRRRRRPRRWPRHDQEPAAKAEAKPRLDIYGFAMLDMGYQTKQNDPNWFDVLRPTKLPSFPNEFGDGRPLLRRRAAEPPRREGLHPDRRRRGQDDLRVRALRYRWGRRADHVPPAARLGRARADRSGPDLEPVHGPGRLPELRRVLGAARDGLLPQRAAAVDAVAGRRLELHDRARAAGRERGPGRLRRPHRAAGRAGALPGARRLRPLPLREGLGPRADRRHRARDQVGRQQQRPVQPQRQRHRLGLQPQHEPEDREARVPGLGGLRRRRARTTGTTRRSTSASRTTSRTR